MSRAAGLVIAAVASIVTAGVLWLTPMPLGIPGEWTWPRLPADAQSVWNLLLAGLVGGAYVTFVAFACRRLSAFGPSLAHAVANRDEVAGWIIGLVAVGVGWLWTVQQTASAAGQLAKAPFILYYPSASGYFAKARYESPDAAVFLRKYEALMEKGDVLHVGTHPPGLFLVFHGLIAIGDRWPGLLTAAWSLAPESVREATSVVQDNTRPGPHPLSNRDAQVLWLAGLLVLILAAATVAPLYGILRQQLPRDSAFLGAAFWPTVPAAAIFWPKSDVAFPFIATLLGWCALSAWKQQSPIRAACAGVVLFAGLLCSLAFLPVALFLALAIGHDAVMQWRARQRTMGQIGIWIACGVAGFLFPLLLLILCDIHLGRIWLWNYRNHAGFYAEYPRTYWKWLLVNPLELAIAVGVPVFVAAVIGLTRRRPKDLTETGLCWAGWWGLGVWAVLWLTGKNSGEAARLWLLLMPGVVAMAAVRWAWLDDKTRRFSPLIWLGLQLAVSILTVHRVGGFHFETL